MLKTTLLDFWGFLKKPTDKQAKSSFKDKIKIIFILFGVEILITLIFIFPLLEWIYTLIPLRRSRLDYDNTAVSQFLFIVILAPIFEELMFRWVLRRQTMIYSITTQRFWDIIFPYLVYLTTIMFGFIHLSNYVNDTQLFYYLAPLIVLSQTIGGLFLAYIRVRFNVFWGMLFHSLWNLFAFSLIIYSHYTSEPYQDKTPHYSIEITEKNFFDPYQKQVLKIDSSQGKIYKMEVEQYSFQHLLDTLYQKEKYHIDDSFIQLKLESKKGINQQEFLQILEKEFVIEKEKSEK